MSITSNMNDVSLPFVMLPYGLPDNVMRSVAGAPRIFSLIPGFNREKRRSFATILRRRMRSNGDLDDATRLMIGFSKPTLRKELFWSYAHGIDGRGKPSMVDHMLCPDAWFLWHAIERFGLPTFDEVAMSLSCQPWSDIRRDVEIASDRKWGSLAKGVQGYFALWPILVSELERWESADQGTRDLVTNAVFALSSISGNAWFLNEALRKQPAMADGLQLLLRSSVPDTSDDSVDESISAGTGASIQQEVLDSTETLDAQWQSLGARLCNVGARVANEPATSELRDLLTEVVRDCTGILERIASEAMKPEVSFQRVFKTLIAQLDSVASEAAFGWLSSDDKKDLQEAWEQRAKSDGAEACEMLLERANKEVATLSDKVRKGYNEYSSTADELKAMDAAATQKTSLQERIALERRAGQLRADLGKAERQYADAKHALWLAIMPPAELVNDEVKPSSEAADQLQSRLPSEGDKPASETQVLTKAADTKGTPVPPTYEDAVNTGGAVYSLANGPAEALDAELTVSPGLPESKARESESTKGVSIPATAEQKTAVDAIWAALEQNRGSLAYQIQCLSQQEMGAELPQTPPACLLAAATLANELLTPDGSIARALESLFVDITQIHLDSLEPHVVATNVLLAAALIRPVLLAPASGAHALVDDIHLGEGFTCLYDLLQVLSEHALRLRQVRLEAQTLGATRDEAAWKERMKQLQVDVDLWMRQAPKMTMKFQAATEIWRKWQQTGGEIYELLEPVRRRDLSSLTRVEAAINRLSSRWQLQDAIDKADRRSGNRRHGDRIHGAALEQFCQRVSDACSFAARWIALERARPKQDEFRDRMLSSLAHELSRLRTRLEAQLATAARNESAPIRAAATFASDAQRSFYALFESVAAGPESEPEPRAVLARPFLDVPDIDVGWDWAVNEDGAKSQQSLIDTISNVVPTHENVERRLERGDLIGATRLVQELEREAAEPEETERTRLRLEAESREVWAGVKEDLHRRQEQVEAALAYGLIGENEREQVLTRLVTLQAAVPNLALLTDMRACVRETDAMLVEKGHQRQRELEERLLKIRAVVPQPDLDVVRETISHGDLPSATEYVHRLEMGESLDSRAAKRRDPFSEFFPVKAREIDSTLDAEQAQSIITAIRRERTIGALSFTGIPGAQRDRAAHLVESWYEAKRLRPGTSGALDRLQKCLTSLVQELGFQGVTSVKQDGRDNDPLQFVFNGAPVSDRDVCPVPFFGSIASGRYRLLCLWDRPSTDVLLARIGPTVKARPALAFYFGRMSERMRREVAFESRRKRQAFLLVDETLIMFLATEQGSRLPALFSCTLPFTSVEPYVTTASIVPPELFYGRQDELRKVTDPLGACFVYGGRQLGKTALLRHAERTFNDPRNKHIAVWIDLRVEGIGQAKDTSKIWMSIYRVLERFEVPGNSVEPKPTIRGRVDTYVDQLREWLRRNPDARLLLLLDEADQFLELDARAGYPDTARLKGLMEQTERRFKVVFAGLHNVLRAAEQANHPLGHFGEPIEVGPLMRAGEWREAARLVRDPLEAAGFKFERDNLVDKILAQTNFYPSLIQLYCSKLLTKLLEEGRFTRNDGPRYLIKAAILDETYRSKELRDEIRQKFRLTLQLDARYAVIAYGIAHRTFTDPQVYVQGLSVRDLRAIAKGWWEEGFRSTSEQQFRTILEEMVGLGVLRVVGEHCFTLRNHNLLLLMGTEQEIEENLICDRDLPHEYSPQQFHQHLRGRGSICGRHPLTAEQISALQRKGNAVVVMCAAEAAGLSAVADALEFASGEIEVHKIEFATDVPSLQRNLQVALERAKAGPSICIVPFDCPWTDRWLQASRRELARLKSRDRHIKVVFIAGPDQLRECDVSAVDSGSDLKWDTVGPWADSFIRELLQDREQANDPQDRQRLFEQTGFWPKLIDEKLTSKTDTEKNPSNGLALFVGTWEDLSKVMGVMVKLDDAVELSDLSEFAGMSPKDCQRILTSAERLALVTHDTTGHWIVEPSVREVLAKNGSWFE